MDKIRILLITPENMEIRNFRKRQTNNFIQITMPYLAAFIDETKYAITLVDEYKDEIPYGDEFELIAITANTPNARHCYDISQTFRKKGCKVVLGGPHVTLLPEEALRHCDFLIVGEAEKTWPLFLDDFYHKKAERIYRTDEPVELCHLPIPRRDLIKNRLFTKGAVFATRGCPYHCSYCNIKQIYDDKFKTRPVDEAIADIKTIKNKHFVFWDDNFFADKSYAVALMTKLIPLKKKWAAQVTLESCYDDEILRLAKQSGCVYFFIGLESFSGEALSSVNKSINQIHQYSDLIRKVHKAGICVQAGIIFGFDTDTPAVFQETLAACNQIGLDGATVSILTPLPKTPLYDKMKRENRLLTEDWTYYNGKTRVAFLPIHMTPKELFEGYMWFRKNFYSVRSIMKRMVVSKTNLLYNIIINIGYKLSLSGTKGIKE
ncbi:MAG: B12-binding domain-containing radical SAM protein [Clostridiales bacterium 43-6]|nr:MAG: B12-binding domain-containing radical SAM protein [Clostridiales bacterium 43-6]